MSRLRNAVVLTLALSLFSGAEASAATTGPMYGAGGIVSATVGSSRLTSTDYTSYVPSANQQSLPFGVKTFSQGVFDIGANQLFFANGRLKSNVQQLNSSLTNGYLEFGHANAVADMVRASLGVAVSTTKGGQISTGSAAEASISDQISFRDLSYDAVRNVSTSRFRVGIEGTLSPNEFSSSASLGMIYAISTSDGNHFSTHFEASYNGSRVESYSFNRTFGNVRVISGDAFQKYVTVEMDHFGRDPEVFYGMSLFGRSNDGMLGLFNNTAYFEFQLNEGATFTTKSGVFHTAPKNLDGVPEPATWAMMVSGFGLLGAVARKRTCLRLSRPRPA